ncbi:hypothetical protein Pelo_1807 [Pelomyxa schiedti]|nr:hypothetical protein Pelo_1807 [Pelomyxa schiedti]
MGNISEPQSKSVMAGSRHDTLSHKHQREQVYVNRLFRQMYVDSSGTITADDLKASLNAFSIMSLIPTPQ